MIRSHALRRRALWVLIATILISGMTFVFAPSGSEALPPNEIERHFYSDATYTNLVGERLLTCGGQTYKWGITTAYVQVYTFPC